MKSIIAASILFLTSCAGYTYNGITLEDVKNPTWSMAGGVVATYAVHMASHIIAAELMDYDWHMDGTSEIIDGQMTDHDAIIFGAAGWAGQLAVGYGMKFAGCKGDFVNGYNTGTLIETALYPATRPLRSGGGDDIDFLNERTSGDLIWAGASILAVGLNTKGE